MFELSGSFVAHSDEYFSTFMSSNSGSTQTLGFRVYLSDRSDFRVPRWQRRHLSHTSKVRADLAVPTQYLNLSQNSGPENQNLYRDHCPTAGTRPDGNMEPVLVFASSDPSLPLLKIGISMLPPPAKTKKHRDHNEKMTKCKHSYDEHMPRA